MADVHERVLEPDPARLSARCGVGGGLVWGSGDLLRGWSGGLRGIYMHRVGRRRWVIVLVEALLSTCSQEFVFVV